MLDFENAGIDCKRDELAFDKGKLILSIRLPHEGQLFDLIIKYPDTYPYFRPEVLAPNLSLRHHQNPVVKNLCLLDQPTDSWDIQETAYELLRQQFPKVIEAGNAVDRASVTDLETHQAEPRSEYYKYSLGTYLLINGDWNPDPTIGRGIFSIGIEPSAVIGEIIEKGLRGAILELQNEAGISICSASDALKRYYKSSSSNALKGHWIMLPEAPDIVDSSELLSFLKINYPKDANYIEKRAANGGEGIVGLIFPEEKGWNSEVGTGWLFFAFRGNKKKNSVTSYLVRAERSGENDLRVRIPELNSLRFKKIAVVGCGCVGAPSVFEFAKCGVGEIRLWDGDTVSPGNACRWPLGLPFSGAPKVEALTAFINAHYPQTSITMRAGFRLGEPDANEMSAVQQFFEGVDLVFDATAERGVQLFLSSKAQELCIPYVMAESRAGGWGGLVARIRPGVSGGCYYCLLHGLKDGSIKAPPAKEEDFIQPQGCISPTFTAASFDTSTISMAAVRLAVSTLIGEQQGAYPSIDHDIGVVSLRDHSRGLAMFPDWKTYPLGRHPNCHCKD